MRTYTQFDQVLQHISQVVDIGGDISVIRAGYGWCLSRSQPGFERGACQQKTAHDADGRLDDQKRNGGTDERRGG